MDDGLPYLKGKVLTLQGLELVSRQAVRDHVVSYIFISYTVGNTDGIPYGAPCCSGG
jgi:hypothetical protein